MTIDANLAALIVCPACRGPLRTESPDGGEAELTCVVCALAYPIQDGIPVLLADHARRV